MEGKHRPRLSRRHRLRPRLRRRLRRRARVVTVLLVLLAALAVLWPAPARAIPGPKFCDNSQAPTPEMAGTGTQSLLGSNPNHPINQPARFVDLHSDATTLFGRYGGAGIHWHTYKLGCFDLAHPFSSNIANQLLGLTKLVVATALQLFQIAFDPHLLDPFAGVVDRVVGGLRDSLYLRYLTPVIILGGLWAAWVALVRRRETQVVESSVWMVGVIAFALWLFAHPSSAITGPDQLITAVTRDGYTAISAATGQGGKPADIPDQIWRALVYEPWLVGEFGTADAHNQTVRQFGERLLGDQAYSYDEAARVQQDPKQADPTDSGSIAARKADDYKQLADQLRQTDPAAYQYFRGTQAGDQTRTALLATAASVCVAGVLLVLGFLAVVFRFGLLLLVLMAPMCLLFGVHPGAGRRAALRWVNMYGGLVAWRIVINLLLALLITCCGVVFAVRGVVGWAQSMVLIIGLAVAILMFRKPLLHMFSQLTTGGEGGLESFESGRARPLASALRLFVFWRMLRWLRRGATATEAIRDSRGFVPEEIPPPQQPAGGAGAWVQVVRPVAGQLSQPAGLVRQPWQPGPPPGSPPSGGPPGGPPGSGGGGYGGPPRVQVVWRPGATGAGGGGNGAAGSAESYRPEEHPDPAVRTAWAQGQGGDINGWRYDPMTGRYARTAAASRPTTPPAPRTPRAALPAPPRPTPPSPPPGPGGTNTTRR